MQLSFQDANFMGAKLRLIETSTPTSYEVGGLPDGQFAKIARAEEAYWQVWHVTPVRPLPVWRGRYESLDAALAALEAAYEKGRFDR